MGRVALLSLLLMPALLLGCKGNSKTKGPSAVTGPSSITGTATGADFILTITINPNAIPPGGTAGITVTATTLNGAPLANRDVQMVTGAGTLSQVSGKTDAAGKFVTSITMTDPRVTGTVQITATVMALTVEAFLNVIEPGVLAIVPSSATMAPGATQFFNCVGGVPPYRWEPSGGTVNRPNEPSVIFTAGSVTGTFVLKCTDSAGNAAQATITITTAVGDALAVTPPSVTLGPGQTQTFQASGGTPPYTWSFPAGAGSLSTTTGPTTTLTAAATPGTFTLLLTDSQGRTASASVTISVPALTLLPETVTRTFGATGAAPGTCSPGTISITFTVSGGAPPYSLSATAGTVTPSTLSGPGTFTYSISPGTLTGGTVQTETITVRDALGNTDTATVRIECVATS